MQPRRALLNGCWVYPLVRRCKHPVTDLFAKPGDTLYLGDTATAVLDRSKLSNPFVAS